MEIIDQRKMRSLDEVGAVARTALAPLLHPLSLVYGGLATLRRCLPGEGPNVGVPVISVGSVLVGGTGKTPLCILVAEVLTGLGRKVCVISRGYGRRSRVSPLAVSDGFKVLVGVGDAGDEPYLMAGRLAGVCVTVDKNRARAARDALRRFRPDAFVLDDGFQTRSIAKSLELVCVDGVSLRSRQYFMPAGRLRESWRAIRPEHVLVAVLEPGEPAPDAGLLGRLGVRRSLVALRESTAIVDCGGREVNARSIGARRLLLLSGIARPTSFEDSCRRLGLEAAVSLRMDDHHWFNDRDAERIGGLMKRYGCTHLVTTEKDLHRLPEALRRDTLVVRQRLTMDEPEAFAGILRQAVGMR